MLLEFPEYLPDLPALNNPGCVEAKNVVPAGNHYRQASEVNPLIKAVPGGYASATASATAALPFHIQGAFSTRNPDGTTINFCADKYGIYALAQGAGAWTGKRSAIYTTSTSERWEFAAFSQKTTGKTHVIATNFSDPVQTYTLGSGANFSNLIDQSLTGVPKARYVDSVRDFVVLGNTTDAVDGNVPHRVRWCGIGDDSSWAVSPVTQADYQDLTGQYGWVTQVVGGEYGVIFQEEAITRMDYVGSPLVWKFDTVETNNGTKYPGSVVPVGNLIFYMGIDGFYVFDGHSSVGIGANKVDRTFFETIDKTYPERICGSVDYENHLICWCVPTDGSNGVPNQLIYYNYAPNAKTRWSYTRQITQYLFTANMGGYNLDTVIIWQTARGGNLTIKDPLLPNVDSHFYIQNVKQIAGFDTQARMGNLKGTPLPAVIETSEVQITPGQRTQLNTVKPVVDGYPTTVLSGGTEVAGTSVKVAIGGRDLLNFPIKFSLPADMDATGQVPMRSNARYHRLRVFIDNGFNDAIGVEVIDSIPGGYR